jgi:hypothetical protein
MNIFDFLKYWLDTHPLMFGVVVIILAIGIASMFENLFKKRSPNDK